MANVGGWKFAQIPPINRNAAFGDLNNELPLFSAYLTFFGFNPGVFRSALIGAHL